jgi:phage shock protein PspC (stress-responsive transcriptional regulator)
MKAVPHSKLTWAAIIAVLLMGASTGLAYLTDDITVVGGIRDLMGPLGLVAAGLCGLAFANYVSSNTRGASSPKGTAAAFIVIALLLAWAAQTVIYLWLGVVIALALSYLAARYNRVGITPPPAVRYMLIAGAFLGGVLPGLILYVILSLVVSDRYCQLTSSKCL